MNPFTAAALSGGLLTVIALYALGFTPQLPPWAVFIAWACFFHLGGGAGRANAYRITLTHLGAGIVAAWLSALAVLQNPFAAGVAQSLWAPVLIGIVIAGLLRLGAVARFSATPAIIYGYAATFAFLNAPGAFAMEKLTAISLENALIAMTVSMGLGVLAGLVNAWLAERLTGMTQRREAVLD